MLMSLPSEAEDEDEDDDCMSCFARQKRNHPATEHPGSNGYGQTLHYCHEQVPSARLWATALSTTAPVFFTIVTQPTACTVLHGKRKPNKPRNTRARMAKEHLNVGMHEFLLIDFRPVSFRLQHTQPNQRLMIKPRKAPPRPAHEVLLLQAHRDHQETSGRLAQPTDQMPPPLGQSNHVAPGLPT